MAMLTKTSFRIVVLTAGVLLLLVLYHIGSSQTSRLGWSFGYPSSHQSGIKSAERPSLPSEDAGSVNSVLLDDNDTCAERYGPAYVHAFGQAPTVYCHDALDHPTLTCFRHQAHDTRVDSFCLGKLVHGVNKPFSLECSRQGLPAGTPSVAQLSSYWYQTGPRAILDSHFDLSESPNPPNLLSHSTTEKPNTLIMIKREGPEPVNNMWHTLMQVMSAMLSLDVLRTTIDSVAGMPYYSHQDYHTSQVVILDDYKEGPFYDLWNILAGMPVVRYGDLQSVESSNVLLPLAGGSNPFWQGDWNDIPCEDSVLFKTFSRRILEHYDLVGDEPSSRHQAPLTLTYVNRTGVRPLLNEDELLPALQAKFPEIHVQSYDFAAIPLTEQIAIARDTDILLGVHGAGLSHGVFMRPGSTVVEIMPPSLNHKGFHAMCKFLGLRYFTERAEEYEFPGKLGDWQKDGVYIGPQIFLPFMERVLHDAAV